MKTDPIYLALRPPSEAPNRIIIRLLARIPLEKPNSITQWLEFRPAGDALVPAAFHYRPAPGSATKRPGPFFDPSPKARRDRGAD